MHFGQYIRKLREAQDMSLIDAATELGMSSQRLCDIEHGRRSFQRPPYDLLKKVAALYDHPYAHLVMNSEFFAYEKSVMSDLLADVEPLVMALEGKTLDMLVEAKQYTPEMEELAVATHKLAVDLKLALLLGRSRLSKAPSGKTPTGTRTRKVG